MNQRIPRIVPEPIPHPRYTPRLPFVLINASLPRAAVALLTSDS